MDESTKELISTEKGVRDKIVSQAVGFLQHPSGREFIMRRSLLHSAVAQTSENEQRSFLARKGLSDHEMAAAFEAARRMPTLHETDDLFYITHNNKSTLAMVAETVLLPLTIALGAVGILNYLWVRLPV